VKGKTKSKKYLITIIVLSNQLKAGKENKQHGRFIKIYIKITHDKQNTACKGNITVTIN